MPVYWPQTNPETGKREMVEVVIPPPADDGFTDNTTLPEYAYTLPDISEEYKERLRNFKPWHQMTI